LQNHSWDKVFKDGYDYERKYKRKSYYFKEGSRT
jgi:hypothetical protein